jgi:uncharacterized protein YhdP
MSRPKKIFLGLAIAIVVLLIGLAVAVPLLFNLDNYRPQATAYIQEQTGKPATITHMALTGVSQRVDPRGRLHTRQSAGLPSGKLCRVSELLTLLPDKLT